METEMNAKIRNFENYLWEKELAPNTIRAYIAHVSKYFEKYEDITKNNLIEWKRWLLEMMKPKSVNHYITAISEYLKFIGKPDLVLKKVKVQTQNTVENVISREEFDKLLRNLKNDGKMKMYYLVLFLGKTGARVSELRQFKKKDLVKGYAEIPTKGKIRRIYFCDSLRSKEVYRFFNELKDDDFLFQNRYGEQITTRGIAQQLINYARKYGINEKVMHPHSFRHFFAIEFLKRDKDISLLADLMGHSSINTTAIYLRLNKQQQIERLNNAMNF